jgi:aminobenzoyl-glutamate utilization protein A
MSSKVHRADDHHLAQAVRQQAEATIALRRDLHRHPEVGWTEFRTTAIAQEAIEGLDPAVLRSGASLYDQMERLGLPDEEVMAAAMRRAAAAGTSRQALQSMEGGFTGLAADLVAPAPGPTIAIRADLDALPLMESVSKSHYPARAGFSSQIAGAMHACAHDAHTAVAIGVARALNELPELWRGRVRFLFQPAEEGTRGADAFVRAGLLDDVDAVLTFHILSNVGLAAREIAPGVSDMLPTEKFLARFTGQPSQFASSPERGRNALTVASSVLLLAHAIPKRPGSRSMINIGRLVGGSAANIVPAFATLAGEIRGDRADDVAELAAAFRALCQGVGAGFGVESAYEVTGYATNPRCDEHLMDRVARSAARSGLLVGQPVSLGASDDASLMIDRVQQRGGVGTYVAISGGDYHPHHSPDFDIDDRILPAVVDLFVRCVVDLSTNGVGRPS